ncbi:MAG: hypothetical protein A3B25_03905 [Candidatus Ryanbacteria bacterium RIFCSPLOWO2_01_FULL_48_26]|uniref:Uncharacterized protein n=1 Tax=Candidatus Ryanbacteria bacterium RIFCSPLOWO2_01_FULL_48_26 TaxID=1802126 RepID=A0A1G2GQZ3_9BACT|nr:MAG: hypothetical protein A3B25_03905 [Candidatus Ryanbacteria bacterium RIFCSPLOWO2_01_FULL_48_26]
MFILPPSRIPHGSAAGMEGSFKSFLRGTILRGKAGGFIGVFPIVLAFLLMVKSVLYATS